MIEARVNELRKAGVLVTLSTVAGSDEWKAEVGSRIQLLGTDRGATMGQALRRASAKAQRRLLSDESYRCDRWREIEAALGVAAR